MNNGPALARVFLPRRGRRESVCCGGSLQPLALTLVKTKAESVLCGSLDWSSRERLRPRD